HHPASTPFPYTTLFRSTDRAEQPEDGQRDEQGTGCDTGTGVGTGGTERHHAGQENGNLAEQGRARLGLRRRFEAHTVTFFLADIDRKSTRLNSSHVSIS